MNDGLSEKCMLKNLKMYLQGRRDAKRFSELICDSLLNVLSFGRVSFKHPITTSSFAPRIRTFLDSTFIGKVTLSIIDKLVELDKHYHVDCLVEGYFNDDTHAKFYFDVKNVEIETISSLNYSITFECQEYFKRARDGNYNWLAFRLNRTYNGGMLNRLDAFICVKAKEIFDNCAYANDCDYLFSLRDILEKCPSKFFVGKYEDLEKFKKYGSNKTLCI